MPDVRGALDVGLAGIDGGALLSGVDVPALADEELVWAARRVQHAVNALEGSRSALVAEAARRQLRQRRGDASLADTLTATTSVSGAQARRLERDAVSVAAKPGVADALVGGGINADQAALLAGASVPEDVRARLTDDAAGQNADQTRKAVRARGGAPRGVRSGASAASERCAVRVDVDRSVRRHVEPAREVRSRDRRPYPSKPDAHDPAHVAHRQGPAVNPAPHRRPPLR